MTVQRLWWRTGTVMLLGALALTVAIVDHAGARPARRRPSVRGKLHSTGVDSNANGQFEENVEDGLPDGSGDIQGELVVEVTNLAPRSKFNVKVGGTPQAIFRTSTAGRGRVRLGAKPRRLGQTLTVDPRGQRVSITDKNGDEVLGGEVNDPTTPGGTRCCMNTADEQGCTDVLPSVCSAAGGVDMGAGSCEPDPCPNTGPADGTADGDGETNDDGQPGPGPAVSAHGHR